MLDSPTLSTSAEDAMAICLAQRTTDEIATEIALGMVGWAALPNPIERTLRAISVLIPQADPRVVRAALEREARS